MAERVRRRQDDDGQHDVTGTDAYLGTTGKPLLYDDVGPNAKGHFIDTGVTSRIPSLRKFTLKGAAAEIAGALLDSEEVRFFGD